MGNINIEKWKVLFFDYGTEYGLKLIGAVIIWIIGSWIIKKIKSLLQKAMNKFKYDESLEKFLTSLIVGSLKVILIILILGQLGIETSSLDITKSINSNRPVFSSINKALLRILFVTQTFIKKFVF